MPGPTTTDSPRRPHSGRSGVASGPDVLLVTKLHVVAVPGRPHPETVERPPGRYLTLTSLPASRRCQARHGQKARQPPPRQARRGQPNRGRRDRGTPARPDSLARYARPIRRRHRRAPPGPAALSCLMPPPKIPPRCPPSGDAPRGAGSYRLSQNQPQPRPVPPIPGPDMATAKEMTMHPCVMKELVRQRERELRRSAPLHGSHVSRERAWLRRMGRRAGRAIVQVGLDVSVTGMRSSRPARETQTSSEPGHPGRAASLHQQVPGSRCGCSRTRRDSTPGASLPQVSVRRLPMSSHPQPGSALTMLLALQPPSVPSPAEVMTATVLGARR